MGGRTFLPFVKERPAPPKIDTKAAASNAGNTSSSGATN